jgi:hypothetical protein
VLLPLLLSLLPCSLLLLLLLQIREMLSACRIEAVRKSLGRLYRLVAAVQLPPVQQQQQGLQQ